MIFDVTAIFLNVLGIVVLSVFVVVTAISLAIKLKPEYLNLYSALSRRCILWLVTLSPWLVGMFAAILAIFSESQYSSMPDVYNFLHWHHPQVFIFNSWHGLTVVIAISIICIILLHKFTRLLINTRMLKLLHSLAEIDEKGFYKLDADAPTVFTVGFFQPRYYITSGLHRQLNDEEYTIIQLHEKEHARRLDPLQKWIFQLFTSFFPKKASCYLNRLMAIAMEQCADAAIYRVISDKPLIALTLLKVRRLTIRHFENNFDDSVVCHYGQDNIEERIKYLLANHQGKIFPFFFIVSIAAVMSVICAFSANIFHHAIEYLLFHSEEIVYVGF